MEDHKYGDTSVEGNSHPSLIHGKMIGCCLPFLILYDEGINEIQYILR